MRRRNFIAGIAALAATAMQAIAAALEPPDDEVKLNRFAQAWNEYVEKLRRWIRGRKEWAAVVKAWDRLG